MSWVIDQDSLKITMTKGDTPTFKINIMVADEEGNTVPYEPEETDKIIFAVKESKTADEPLFTIPVDKETMTVTFKQEDTKPLAYGKYIWEVSLNKDEEDYHCTFITEKTLILTTEVY